MAIYRLEVSAISRSAGRSATAAAAYRAGDKIVDERTGEIHDYTRKGGVESADVVLPAGAPEWAADRSKLWNAAEAAERRKDACVAREVLVALPAELGADDRRRLALDFAKRMADAEGCAVEVCIHAPGRGGDDRNHHAHMLRTTRRVEADGLGQKLASEQAGRARRADLAQLRSDWADLCNQRLREAGIGVSVDHRSLAAQGIDRIPQPKLGVAAVALERRRGIISENRLRWMAQQAAHEKLRDAAQEARRDVLRAEGDLSRLRAEESAQNAPQRPQRPSEGQYDGLTAQQLRERIQRERELLVEERRAVGRDAEVLASLEASRQAGRERDKAAGVMAGIEEQAQAWREAHPVQNWLHDNGIRPSRRLAELTEPYQEAWRQREAARVRSELAEGSAQRRMAMLEAIIEQQQEPEHARLNQLGEVARKRGIEEQAEAKRLRERERVPQALRDIVARREAGYSEWRDNGSQWQAAPQGLRELVDGLARVPKGPARDVVLERVMQNGKDKVAELIEQQRQQYRAQDRGLSR